MSSTKASLAAVARKVVADERRRLGPPPSLDELADYAAGELTEEEAQRIRDDLALRPDGRDVVLDLKSFPRHEPPSEKYRVSDDDLGAAWRSLEAELGNGPAPREPAARAPVARARAWLVSLKTSWRSPVLVPALATSFLLGIAGASLWHRETPRLNVEVSDLVSASDVVRSGESPWPNTFSAGADPFVWILNLTDLTSYSAYVVEVLDADEEVVWSGQARRRTSARNLNVEIPRGFLSAGSYRVRLFGSADGERKPLEEYQVRIER